MGSINDQNGLYTDSPEPYIGASQDDQRRIALAEKAAAIAQSKAQTQDALVPRSAESAAISPSVQPTVAAAAAHRSENDSASVVAPAGTTSRIALNSAAAEAADKKRRRARRNTGLIVSLVMALVLTAAMALAWWADLLPSFSGVAVSDSVPHDDDAARTNTVSGTDAILVTYPHILSGSDTISYPEIHIDGITLPEEFGDGLLDSDAAFCLINMYRVQNGMPELQRVNQLTMNATLTRLNEASFKFSHTRPDGSRFSTVFSEYDILYTRVVENLAEGQYTAEHVVKEWIESPTHCTNLLDEQITAAAVACAANENGLPVWIFIGIKYA